MRTKRFDINASLATKGIAILMLLFFHLFLNGSTYHERYDIVYYPFPEKNICNIATVCKICVGLFALISGYGLYLNYKKTNLSPSKWVVQREMKLLSGFWFVVVCCWVVCQIINGYPQTKYFSDNIYKGITNMLIEFLGCSTLFGTPTLTGVWWYMSAGVVFIAAVPLIISLEDKLLPLLLAVVALPRILGVGYQGSMAIYSFLFTFLLGMICAKYDFVNKWINCRKFMRGGQICNRACSSSYRL